MVKLNADMKAGTDAATVTDVQVNHVSQNIAKPALAAVVSMLVTQDDFWKDVCNKVVGDALFEQKCITDTVEYLKSKYKIELLSGNGG